MGPPCARLVPEGRGGMSHEVTRRRLERWLLEHGFVELASRKTGHRQFAHGSLKITLSGHGPQDLTKKHVALIVRQLAAGGFDKQAVRRELSE
jgi:predicted RNA binding protein YcfA (HicA-like mRNA interferase family)